jgi:hypothetical protein
MMWIAHGKVTHQRGDHKDTFWSREEGREESRQTISVALVRNKLYRPSDRRLSAKVVPTFADRGCRVVSATDPHSRILGFLDRSRYYFFQVAPQIYSRG